CEPNASDESKVDVPAAAASAASPDPLPGVADNEDIPWTKGSGKCKGKHWKGCWFGFGAEPAEPAATVDAGREQQEPAFAGQKQDTDGAPFGQGPVPGNPWKLLSTLRMLKESGFLAPAIFSSLAVQWLPFMTQIAAQKVETINRMAQEGLDPSLQKMLEIIQEQAAKTPGLEPHAALIAEALSGDNGQRRLGDALLEFLKALQELGPQVQARFCEAVAASLLPLLEDFSQWAGQGKCKGNRGEHGQNHVEPPAATAAMSEDELEAKVLQLLELQLASEEVIRDLLIANDGDVAKVSNLLTS
ncbi:ZZ-type domain-containing protein, partial [Durusdinium trenchii]